MCRNHSSSSNLTLLADAELVTVAIGDWGRDGFCCQRDVALEMALVAEKFDIPFVLNTGDNFYENGLRNLAQFDTSFRDGG